VEGGPGLFKNNNTCNRRGKRAKPRVKPSRQAESYRYSNQPPPE